VPFDVGSTIRPLTFDVGGAPMIGASLGQAIGDILPSAVGVAISPVPIIAVILVLGTPRARTNGSAFAIGWVIGLVIVGVVVLLVANGADDPDSGSSTTVDVVKLVFGLLFLVLAGAQWRKRPRPGFEAPWPKWMQAIDQFSAGKAFGLGVVLSAANPKNLGLTLASAASIAQADSTPVAPSSPPWRPSS
jgi:threonine/homoserine/homoserine lactone efflux protein